MSYGEKRVALFLNANKIRWEYEKQVKVFDEGNRERLWYPDFYLTDIGLYVEVCGLDRRRDYSRRDEIYKKNNVPIIFVHTYKDEIKWKFFLEKRIEEHQQEYQQITNLLLDEQPDDYLEERRKEDEWNFLRKQEEEMNFLSYKPEEKTHYDVGGVEHDVRLGYKTHYPNDNIYGGLDSRIDILEKTKERMEERVVSFPPKVVPNLLYGKLWIRRLLFREVDVECSRCGNIYPVQKNIWISTTVQCPFCGDTGTI